MDWPNRTMAERPHAFRHHLTIAAGEAIAEAERGPSIHGPMASISEGYTILLEEVDEVFDVIRGVDQTSDLAEELIQVAAVALRMAVIAKRERWTGSPPVFTVEVKSEIQPLTDNLSSMADRIRSVANGVFRL